MKDPLVSPAYADYFKGFPTCMITTGTRDLFLSDCVRLYWSLNQAHVPVELKVFEGMFHAFEIIPEIPEWKLAEKKLLRFLKNI
jgi:epsilon-lactone hydrolase